jgi:7-cyano-7-deazaguanine synthase in queuosine biosynthesis
MRQKLVIRDDISVGLPKGPIGISFSGGVDSSLLVYLVLNQIKDEPVHLFTLSIVGRNLSQHKITSDVLNKICQLTNNYNIIQHVSICNNDATAAANMQVLPRKMLYEQQSIKSMLYGDNANPPADCGIENFEKFKMFNENFRSPLYTRSMRLAYPGQFCPLTNLNKQDIVKIYCEQGIIDTVFPLTKSCSSDYGSNPCGTCWFCGERSWGLAVLN